MTANGPGRVSVSAPAISICCASTGAALLAGALAARAHARATWIARQAAEGAGPRAS